MATLPLSLAPAEAGIRRVAEPAVGVVTRAQEIAPATLPMRRQGVAVKSARVPAPGQFLDPARFLDEDGKAPLLPFRQSEGICAATTVCEMY